MVDNTSAVQARVPMQQQDASGTTVIIEQISRIRINDSQKQGNNEGGEINDIEVHGDWMVVTRKKRNNGPKNQVRKQGVHEKNNSPFNSNHS
jgi:hypothetical protein